MIPILYESNETSFITNGLGRLYDAISVVVIEERNGIYECNFEYPVNGAHYKDIRPGRIIAVEHDYSGDIQPFDIVSNSKPINGIVKFRAVHISYRQSKIVVSAKNINSLADAFTALASGQPENPFTYYTDKESSTGFVAAFDGVPRSVRSILGGVEGSILDTYRGEFLWDKFNVSLLSSRGTVRDITIRYGLNLIDYNEDTDYSETFSACVPYWTGQNAKGVDTVVKGSYTSSGLPTISGRDEAVPLDLTDKFETIPSPAQLNEYAANYLSGQDVTLPQRSITIDFVRLEDSLEYANIAPLLQCSLCDSVKVVFPMYGMVGTFKIVKTEYNVLLERFNQVELGTLSVSLADALGITNGLGFGGGGIGQSFLEMSEHVLINGLSISSGSAANNSATVSKSGYYPLGIVGWRCASGDGSGGSFCLPHALRITSQGSGSADITLGARAVGGNVNNTTFYVTILWEKEA